MKLAALFLTTSLVAAAQNLSAARALTVAINAGVEGDGLKAAAARYQKLTGTEIQISEFPYNNLYSKILLGLSGSPSPFDVVMIDDPWFPKLAEQYLLEDLTPYYKQKKLDGPDSDFVPASRALGRFPYGKGRLHALPFVGNCKMFFYRKDILKKYGFDAPKTWFEVVDFSKKIMAKEPSLYGYAMRGEKGNPIVVNFLPVLWAFGGDLLDQDGKIVLNSAQAIEALKFYVGPLKSVAPKGVENFNADQVASLQLQGQLLMATNWPAWIATFNDPNQSKVVGKMEFGSLPGAQKPGRSVIGNWLVGVARNSDQKARAFEFIHWLTGKEEQRINALETGNPPTRVSVYNDKELLRKNPHYPAQLKALSSSKPRPRTPRWMEIENVLGIHLSQALIGQVTPEQALGAAEVAISQILTRGR
ncbi:MAG: ABC transporter substrate-binding protein [Elusimicrobia bacterium]|nr:ABC transporter substrate-binding protein [Elusimicrobiota bacterium]